jgi:hypothetical protein
MKTEKKLNRRHFIGMTAAGSSALFTQSCGTLNNHTAAQPLRIRKDVEKLNEEEKKLLKKVVRTLKDNGMWITLARIHTDRCANVHGTALFLPWHRAYLNYFEQIARQLPDCSNFTLPYWDWKTSSTIPQIFGEDSEKPWDSDLNTVKPPGSWNLPPDFLWERTRKPMDNAGKLYENIDSAKTIYAIVGKIGSTISRSFLEFGAHSEIHDFIGGNMKVPETAALDPVFWLHHANIDRLWSKWMERNLTKVPSPDCPIEGCENCKFEYPDVIKDWLKSPLYVESDSSNLKVYDLIDSRKLGYIYENTPETVAWDDCPQIGKIKPDYSTKSGFDVPKTAIVNGFLTVGVEEVFTSSEKLNSLGKIQTSLSEFLQTPLPSDLNSTFPSLLLTIEVEKPENPSISVMVFINAAPDPSKLTEDSQSYAATFSFFESIFEHHHHNHGSDGKIESRSFIFDITDTILKLENFKLTEATISICPKLLREKPNSNTEKINLTGFGFSLVQYETDK